MKLCELRACVEKLVIKSAVDYKMAQQLLMFLYDHQVATSNRYEKKLVSHRQLLIYMKAIYQAEDQVIAHLKKKEGEKISEYETGQFASH
jgi:hypothetical protein